ncbi:MAG: antitoxin family protein [Thermodesulfobacteriota bacterium]|nr:antitoxin family protein [Thermodesulfobacteriota bacterium]
MTQVLNAIFENGVFKPLEKIRIKEHEQVTIKIFSMDQWQTRFSKIIDKIHKKASQYAPEEIDTDISQAIQEIREEKRGR